MRCSFYLFSTGVPTTSPAPGIRSKSAEKVKLKTINSTFLISYAAADKGSATSDLRVAALRQAKRN
jgi:hypothetical protein